MVPVELASKFMQLIFFFIYIFFSFSFSPLSVCFMRRKSGIYFSGCFNLEEWGGWVFQGAGCVGKMDPKWFLMGKDRTCCSVHKAIFCSTGCSITTCSFLPFRPPGDNRIFINRPCGSGLLQWNLINLCPGIPTLFVWPVRRCSICSKMIFSVLQELFCVVRNVICADWFHFTLKFGETKGRKGRTWVLFDCL